MPRQKQTLEDSTTATTGTGVTMSNEQFNMLLATVRDSALQTNSDLLDQFNRLRSPTPQTRLPLQNDIPPQHVGSFAKCTARFSGSDSSNVDAFLDNVITFKDICKVSNENALRGISMLLEEQASTWWIGIKNTISTWDEAVTALRETFSRKLPPYLIFKEIFSREQGPVETTESFVCHVRALLSQLPYELCVEAQIDIVFGLLNRRIRKRLLRSELKTFKELLVRARDVERSLFETSSEVKSKDIMKNLDHNQKSKPRCAYCKNFGHNRDECQKLKKKEKPSETSRSDVVTTTKPQLACYGCGALGVVRSKCSTCQNKGSTLRTTTLQANSLSFYPTALNVDTGTRPLLPITIDGFYGAGFADSGAQASIAGAKLYGILQSLGYEFESSVGKRHSVNILKTKSQC